MATQSLLASAWALEVNTGTSGAPTWTRVKGMTSFKETIESTVEDDSDFDSNGWGSDQVTQRKWKLECEGKRKRDAASPSSFVADPGQQAILDAGNLVGVGSNIEIRYYRRDGAPDAWQGLVSVQYGGGGGPTTGLEPFNFTLGGQGARTAITNPAA
ncbi:phage tail tube protein [Streptosporangium sp. NPDC001559]|uniref:Phage tail tube protein n=1 Tax=Streptosporangium jomthongense TaxID=1193683 RepID=A0ABV8EYP4_9ACTN